MLKLNPHIKLEEELNMLLWNKHKAEEEHRSIDDIEADIYTKYEELGVIIGVLNKREKE